MVDKLTKFHLDDNSISDKGAMALAKVLEHVSQLTELRLTQNQISDSGEKAIAKALVHTTKLTVLSTFRKIRYWG